MSLSVVFASVDMWSRTGSTLYTRDMVLELRRRGHRPAIYTMENGVVGRELQQAGVPVVTRLRQLPEPPDVIHGNHQNITLEAVQYFPGIPALYVCHNHLGWDSATPLHPRIRRYLGVSRLCQRRLLDEGANPDQVGLRPNAVDLGRFRPRRPLPSKPQRALVFSNYAHADTQLPAVQEACRQVGLDLDIVGRAVGRLVSNPETILGAYDVVFAKARAAMEAMAVGTAVVLCDYGGAGPMVSAGAFDELYAMNFGFEALRNPLKAEYLFQELMRYDPVDAARVSDRMRQDGSLEKAADRLLAVYETILAEQRQAGGLAGEKRRRLGVSGTRMAIKLQRMWFHVPDTLRNRLKRHVPGFNRLLYGVRDSLLGRK